MNNATMTFETLEDYVAAAALLATTTTAIWHGYRKDGHWVIEFTGAY